MKRAIKFKAKRISDGKWVFGDIQHTSRICSVEEAVRIGRVSIPCIRVSNYDVDEDTICQYIGIKDCHGQEIYEGDIITDNIFRFVVIYSKSSLSFCVIDSDCYRVPDSESYCLPINTFPISTEYWIDGNVYDIE